jgi:predicted DNA-binding protein (MmcQ/YjbR family)
MASAAQARKKLTAYALGFPEAYEDHPWGEIVAKVNKKVFVFLGVPEKGKFGLSVKLPEAREFAMTFPFTEPTGYGLGKAGWVSASFGPGDDIPVDMLMDWIDESYRAVAPKRLSKQLDS